MRIWADDSLLIRKEREIITKLSELKDKKRKRRSVMVSGGTLKSKKLVEKLKLLGY